MLLEAQPDMEIIGEAENGRETIEKVRTLQPDVVLMDIEMPGMNGIEATRQIKENMPKTAVLALTMYEDDQYFFEMLKAGAAGYIPKRAAPDALVNAIHTVQRGEVFLYPSMAAYLVEDYLQRDGAPEEDGDMDQADLTAREKEVLVLIAQGLTNGEISDKLTISVKTVDRHRENMMRKLNVHNRIDLVKYALKKGLIDLDS